MVCFAWDSKNSAEKNRACELFDGLNVSSFISTNEGHYQGRLGMHNGRPTAIAGKTYPYLNEGYSETLTEEGWVEIERHPRYSLKRDLMMIMMILKINVAVFRRWFSFWSTRNIGWMERWRWKADE